MQWKKKLTLSIYLHPGQAWWEFSKPTVNQMIMNIHDNFQKALNLQQSYLPCIDNDIQRFFSKVNLSTVTRAHVVLSFP